MRKAFVALAILAAGCHHGGPAAPDESPAEDDWTLPASVTPAANSGFFNEELAPAEDVRTRVVDVTWRQLEPTKGVFVTNQADDVYDMHFPSLDDQLASADPFWLRIWISGKDQTPAWVQTECAITPVTQGYMGDPQLPIWNACFW